MIYFDLDNTLIGALLVDRATRPYISNNSETSPIYSPASADEISLKNR